VDWFVSMSAAGWRYPLSRRRGQRSLDRQRNV
jgi:hypothetical protein